MNHRNSLWILVVVCAMGLMSVAGPASAAPIPIAHWSFDADFSDSSASGNDLSVGNGTPTITTTAGEYKFGGGALNLTYTDDEYLSLGTTEAFSASDPWSVSFWGRRNGTSDSGMIMGKAGVRKSFIWSTGAFQGMRFRPQSSGSASNDFEAPKDYRTYHHYVMVADGTGKLTLYVDNGTPQVKTSAASGTSFTINAIGYAYNNLRYSFGGQLDEIYVFDVAIDSGVVDSLYNSNTVPEPATLSLLVLGGIAALRRRRKNG